MSPVEGPIRVVIAEDHYLVREGTRQLLESSGQVSVVAAVGDAVELHDAVGRLDPDAVIVDIRMPPDHRTEGIDAARAIRFDHPDIGIVVLSQYVNPLYALELFRDGTEGLAYLLKDRVGDRDELVRALQAVIEGRSVVDSALVESLLSRGSATDSPIASLTDRELEVLHEMAQGKSNQAISDALCVSSSSVEKHINAILAKLGLHPEDTTINRRVAAVLAFLNRDEPAPPLLPPARGSERA